MLPDTYDKKILIELCANARQPATVIGKKVRLSREVVEYRIMRLCRKGIIKKFVTEINIEKLEYYPYNILLQFQNFDARTEALVASGIAKHPAIRWAASCFGTWDIILRLNAKDRRQFEEFFDGIISPFKENIRRCEILAGLQKFKKVVPAQLFGVRQSQEISKKKKSSEDTLPSAFRLTPQDSVLLYHLSNNARASLIELSKHVSLTPEAVKYRLKRLESEKIIISYSCLIDVEKLGFSWYILLFSVQPLTAQEEHTFETLIGPNEKIWFCDKNIGAWNLRMELLAKNTADFHTTLIELRKHLGTKMNSFELLLIFKEYINERFPEIIGEGMRGEKDRNKKKEGDVSKYA